MYVHACARAHTSHAHFCSLRWAKKTVANKRKPARFGLNSYDYFRFEKIAKFSGTVVTS